ncbi:DUF5644 domain-containing protein [Campylobacter insulaenigrae]|uniref:DUF5644 domain-containing protein n=1 Tax=Campylobacter insulaenigrae TaxID=260714 RepID=A0ABY3G4X8_9BACT|nr:DUF5644 domain-containing protein [Campylobacter insulaenigrae]MCR6570497.1 DUF5644 domain-containing protein [Campylobacter insulaenigrae]MCR6572085.1 DUF5644 domain-containing protein [Campylobacter insulaenigrae]MCR6573794.1 DUF5644 domain-containing protein [Campylobacter insulaenigrae]MCR6575556.1 DUF5644 domain-containing protein [Campylobacter insulaenigrae]MCR6576750.1 DUF5644 domain-containing protein [Campylobacter insulaenigrae]
MKIILRIFRFDKNSDYLAYYKPYVYESNDFQSIYDLLLQIKKDDIYFDFENNSESCIKVNQIAIRQRRNLKNIIDEFGTELIIEPLDTKRAIKDLIIDKSDFYEKFKLFEGLVDTHDIELYKQYDFLYYTSETREFLPQYLGGSFFIFAYKMLLKYPEKTPHFLKLVADEEKGIYYHTSFKNFISSNESDYEAYIKELKILLVKAGYTRSIF